MTAEEFIGYAIKEMAREKIKITLDGTQNYVMSDGELCSGFFDPNEEQLEFSVSLRKPYWIETFVHEFCHFEQWKENCDVWKKSYLKNGTDCLDSLHSWFNGKIKLTKKQAKDYAERSGNVERDCEIRSIKKIREFNLPINIKQYSKCANAYIAFYWTMPELKSWCKTTPYQVKEILDKMPDTIEDVDHAKLAKENLKLYKKYCIAEGNEDC